MVRHSHSVSWRSQPILTMGFPFLFAAYFGLLALLGDRRFRLSKRPADADAGKLVYTATTATPKRWAPLMRIDRRVKWNDMGYFGLAGGKITDLVW